MSEGTEDKKNRHDMRLEPAARVTRGHTGLELLLLLLLLWVYRVAPRRYALLLLWWNTAGALRNCRWGNRLRVATQKLLQFLLILRRHIMEYSLIDPLLIIKF